MPDFWAKQAQANLASATAPTSQLLAEAQTAAEAAGHGFYKVNGPFAALDDLIDEVKELEEALRENHDKLHIRNEIGDVLFSLINICRQQNINFEDALHRSAHRWLARKALQEEKIRNLGYTWRTIPREINDKIWPEVKAELKTSEYTE